MLTAAARRIRAFPAAPGAPRRVWRDWLIIAAALVGAVVEILVRPGLPWVWLAFVQTVGASVTVLWRRTYPWQMLAIAFGSGVAIQVAAAAAHSSPPVTLGANAYVLILVYALVRWGSGRDLVIGSAIVLAGVASGPLQTESWGDMVGGLVVLSLTAAVGVSVRQTRAVRVRTLDQVRLREREQLARELHDTVAHHVSAMVVRAQAGQVVADADPAAARDALAVIESEGARTLAEMRALVGALRHGDDAALTPQGGLADLERLAAGVPLAVTVEREGPLDDVGTALEAAVYRCVQESLTNVVRHGRHVAHVVVRVVGDDRAVRTTIVDDGDPVAARVTGGYGLIGMGERAALLGGTVLAGPGPARGWSVEVVLPRTRA